MQKVHSAEDQRADGRAGSFRGFPREEANQTSSVLQEEMMSPSPPGTIGGEFTKWLKAWMLRSEKLRASQTRKSKIDSKNDVRMIRDKTGHIETSPTIAGYHTEGKKGDCE
jgi:hypothetical protein